MPVLVNDGEVRVRIEGQARHWPSGKGLPVAEVQFDRENYE